MKDRIIFYLPTALKISLLDEAATQGIDSISILLEKICDAYLQRKPMVAEPTQKQETDLLKMDILRATKRIKEADAKIKEKFAEHYEIFGVPPSPQAKQAITIGAKNNFEPVRTEPQNQTYSKPITQKSFDASQHCTTLQDMMKGYHAKCNYCAFTTAHSRDESHEAILDIRQHVESRHYSEVWK